MEFLGIFLIADFPKHVVCKHTNIANHRGITEVAEEGVSNVIDGKHTEETELQSRCWQILLQEKFKHREEEEEEEEEELSKQRQTLSGMLLTDVIVASGAFEKVNKPTTLYKYQRPLMGN